MGDLLGIDGRARDRRGGAYGVRRIVRTPSDGADAADSTLPAGAPMAGRKGHVRAPTAGMAMAIGTFACVVFTASAGQRFSFDPDNVPGWSLMSSGERAEHHRRLTSMTTVDECREYMTAHQERMENRARERGKTVRSPRYDVCEQMVRKGLLR